MGFTSFENFVSLQKNPYVTRQNPQNNVSHVLMATSSSTTFGGPRKARFACKRCYEGLPELFSAGEGYSQQFDKSKFEG